MTELLSREMIELAEASGLRFMDQDGEKTGVILSDLKAYDREPMMLIAGREVLVKGPDHSTLWELRMQTFFKKTDQGLLFYYVPIPKNLEIPSSWYGEVSP